MKRAFSLRTQLFGLMALLVLLQSLALVTALGVSRVFLMLDAEAFRLLDSTASGRAQTFNSGIGLLVDGMAGETRALSNALQAAAAKAGVDESSLHRREDTNKSTILTGAEALMSLMENYDVSGAFFILGGSGVNADDPQAHGAVYLRNTATGAMQTSADHYQEEIGSIAVSQHYQIPTSVNWRLDMRFAPDMDDYAYYTKPQEAARQDPRAEMERYGYWMPPHDVLGDGKQVVTYTMPLLSAAGEPFGVLGIEISLSMFTQHYLPNTDLPYQNSFYAIAPYRDGVLDMQWLIPSGPLAQVYLRQGTRLPLKAVATTTLYETELEGMGSMYLAVQPLTMYSRNSPFIDEGWSLVGFVPQAVLRETSSGVRAILTGSIVGTTALSFAAIFLLTYITTRKIKGLSNHIQGLTPFMDIQFKRTGISEIDELTQALGQLNRDVMNASKTTSKILELTLLPIGGFEDAEGTGYVAVTEYIYHLLGIPPGTELSKEEWVRMYGRLREHPTENYENTYTYIDGDGEERWLRIVETQADTGTVGVILDVSKDVAEHRRLAHELDYDALTHLYSRTAFKREVFRRIHAQPQKLGAMIFVDLDNLKYMNDTFGHDMGDRLIIRAGELFRQFERYDGVVARISGDEFAIYLHGCDTKDELRALIHGQYAQEEDYTLRTPDGTWQKIRFSSGVAFYPDDSDNATDLLKLSDYAMYEAKHNQKGSVFEFNRESYTKNVYLLENREAINRLLDEKLIRFAFQPIVDLETGEIYAYEALMRPLLDNFKSPLEILSVAASQSKLGQLERLVMMMALQAARERRQALGGCKLFVNSIPNQMLSQEDYLMLEREYADLYESIVMEIIEGESSDPELLRQKVARMRVNGMQLAIDDFGSGHSNEIRILSIEPDIVKVDMALIRDIDISPDKQMLLGNLVSFCHAKGIRMVAEGVERREELAEIMRHGVDYVQGYYTGKPNFDLMPIEDKIRKEILFLKGSMRKG